MATKKITARKADKTKIPTVKKHRTKSTKLWKEALKNFIFEKLWYGYTVSEIAETTGYTPSHISHLSSEIDDEFMLEVQKDRDTKIKKQIRRIEATSKKLYKAMELESDTKMIIAIQAQILKTQEYLAKLQWLLVSHVEAEVKSDKASELLTSLWIFKDE